MAYYGIIYASGSKMIRRIISGSGDLEGHVGDGESLLVVQQQNAPNLFEAQDAVEAATGVTPADTHCAIVDEFGAIKDIIKADPAIDSVANHQLVPTYEGVTKDCAYDAGTGLFIAPTVTVKAGTLLKDGTVTTVATTTGGPIEKPVDVVDETVQLGAQTLN